MSRIGMKPVPVAAGVKVTVNGKEAEVTDNTLTLKHIRKDQKISAEARVLFTREQVRELSVETLSAGVEAAFWVTGTRELCGHPLCGCNVAAFGFERERFISLKERNSTLNSKLSMASKYFLMEAPSPVVMI